MNSCLGFTACGDIPQGTATKSLGLFDRGLSCQAIRIICSISFTADSDGCSNNYSAVTLWDGYQISNCKKGGVGKTLLSKLKAAYCLESELDFYAVDADRQESFLKAYPEFALPTRFSELDRNLKIPDRILDLALEKLVLVDLPGNVEEAFNHWLTAIDILEASRDLDVKIQNCMCWMIQLNAMRGF